MKKTTMRNFARLIARMGANVQKGQEVVIRAGLDQPEFVAMTAEECYKAGASKVRVEWDYQPLEKLAIRHRTLKSLSRFDDWEIAKLKHGVKALPAMIYIDSEDPNGMKGVNQKKVSKASQARYPIIKPFRDAMENKYQWVIAAVPGKAWAKSVFPGLRANQAMEKLWEAILYTSRADGPDPVQAWKDHNADLAARCAYLNSLGIRELLYRADNGTDLKVGLIPDALFMGGSEKTLSGVEFNPNIPSEEVFTSPMKGEAEGIVYSTRPLSYRGEIIENFSVRFEKGKVVEVKAEKNEALLREMVGMDEGASMLGEVALVPYDSPIRNSEIVFNNTLFDENACCHLALGRGFENCIKDFDKYTLEECRAKGINNSMIHVDFMVGSPDLEITAITADGKKVPIFRNGNWAF